jgi:hypothetical protein
MHDLRERLLKAGIGHYNKRFVSGVEANNKLDLDFETINRFPELRTDVLNGLGKLAVVHAPDLIVPIPNGANGYGSKVARALGIDFMILGKNPVTKDIFYNIGDLAALMKYRRIVLVEDVPNALTTTNTVLAMRGMAERVVGVIGIWDRGDPAIRLPLPGGVAVSSIVQEYIPAQLGPDSPLWDYAE